MNESFARPGGREAVQERRRLARRRRRAIGAYAGSATLGGATTGFVLSSVGGAVRESWMPYGEVLTAVMATVVALVACVLQWQGRMRPLVERKAQVPRRWLLWRNQTMTAAAFGFVLGAGVFTYLHHAAAYVLGAALLLAPSETAGAALGAVYGSAWGFVLLFQSVWSHRRGQYELRDRSMYDRKTLRTLAIAGIVCFSLAALTGGPV